MDTPILETVTHIIEKGKFKKSKKSESTLKSEIEKLFKMHRQQGTEDSARLVHSQIIELARLGKSEMANKYAMRFEEEVGYEQF